MTTGQFNFDRQRAGFFRKRSCQRHPCRRFMRPSLAHLSVDLSAVPSNGGRNDRPRLCVAFSESADRILLVPAQWSLGDSVVFALSQCGGFAYFADPNWVIFQVPQFLVFLVSPMQAIQLTFLLFSLIGLAGSYGLMRHAFLSSRAAAVLAAGIFLLNGFFAYRMLIGHLTFHAFTLIPVMAVAVLSAETDRRPPLQELVGRACVAGACLAYMFQSGMVHGIPPALLAMVVILMIYGLCFGWRWRSWLLLAGAGALSLALCAGKLVAELALLSSFPRDLQSRFPASPVSSPRSGLPHRRCTFRLPCMRPTF